MFDCFGVRFVPPFWKKGKLSKWPKKPENGTNMDIILSFLAKSVDKHSITLVHITYPPLVLLKRPTASVFTLCTTLTERNWKSQ